MSDKAEKNPQAAPSAQAAADVKPIKGGLLTKTPVLLGGVMVIEAVLLLGGFWIFRGKPQVAAGATLTTETTPEGEKGAKPGKTVEIPLVELKALNRTTGRNFLFDVSIFVVAKAEHEQRVTESFKDNKALIEDRIRTIIAESDPEKLGGGTEPGLETLRRQVKYQLERMVGEGSIEEVLVPRCIPFRTDF